MADVQLLQKDGYGQLELNQVAFRRDGRIEAQCALAAGAGQDFASTPAENGMLLAVDNSARLVEKATPTNAATMPVGLHYSTEHMYDERALGLKHFKLDAGSFLPRIGYLSVGDRFTTNLVAYDASDDSGGYDGELMAKLDLATTPAYGEISASAPGVIYVTPTAPASGLALRVVEKTTMPDGQAALKFVVLRV